MFEFSHRFFRSELAKEREEKTKLRDEMSRLSQLQQRSVGFSPFHVYF